MRNTIRFPINHIHRRIEEMQQQQSGMLTALTKALPTSQIQIGLNAKSDNGGRFAMMFPNMKP